MQNPMTAAFAEIEKLVTNALKSVCTDSGVPSGELPPFEPLIPGNREHGDISTNVAMKSAKLLKMPPKAIADKICQYINEHNHPFINTCEPAGAGFINFFLSPEWYAAVVRGILQAGESYGRSDMGKGERVMVEYVSANPTGPMHLGNARGGALGDCLASVLSAAGYNVHREFYVNDVGNQIAMFGLSLEARYLQIFKGEDAVEFPENGYHGDDIKERAAGFAKLYGDKYVDADPRERRQALIDYALPMNIAAMKAGLAKYRIEYDLWFPESELHKNGTVDKAIGILKEKGLTYEADGALWYKATERGGQKDEVLVRSDDNKTDTYFAADIAYHYNKFVERGFDKVIDVWGADHHWHVARLKGVMDALDVLRRDDPLPDKTFDIIINQMVNLVRDGETVRMSKRTGKAITLENLIEEVPVDAARFFFNLLEANSQLDFDLNLAAEQSSKNPVYYVQYAHARICSIEKNLAAEGIAFKFPTDGQLANCLTAPEEKDLIFALAGFPSKIEAAARLYSPAEIARYAILVASLFHKFYTACRIKGEAEDLLQARLALAKCTGLVLKNILTLFKIDCPEIM